MIAGLQRLRNNPDFVELRKHLDDELLHYMSKLVDEADPIGVAQLQGRAKQLQDTLKTISGD